jgi:hypothetical protein
LRKPAAFNPSTLALLIFFSPRTLAPIGGPRPVEPKAVQAARQPTA